MKTSIFDRIFQLSHPVSSTELDRVRKNFIDTAEAGENERCGVARDLVHEAILRNLLDVYALMALAAELNASLGGSKDYVISDHRMQEGAMLWADIFIDMTSGKTAEGSKIKVQFEPVGENLEEVWFNGLL